MDPPSGGGSWSASASLQNSPLRALHHLGLFDAALAADRLRPDTHAAHTTTPCTTTPSAWEVDPPEDRSQHQQLIGRARAALSRSL